MQILLVGNVRRGSDLSVCPNGVSKALRCLGIFVASASQRAPRLVRRTHGDPLTQQHVPDRARIHTESLADRDEAIALRVEANARSHRLRR